MKKTNPIALVPIFNQMRDPTSKSAIMLLDKDYKIVRAFERQVPKVLKQTIDLESYGPCVSQHNFGWQIIKDTFPKLVEAGIPQYLFSYLLNFELRALLDDPPEPYVFSVEDLRFGFVIWWISCGISCIIFMLEIFCKSMVVATWETRNHMALAWFLKELGDYLVN